MRPLVSKKRSIEKGKEEGARLVAGGGMRQTTG